MRKLKGPVLFLAAALLLGSAAMAADNLLRGDAPAVIYDAKENQFYFSLSGGAVTPDSVDSDLFSTTFKNLMPGDVKKQTIQTVVRNIPEGQQVELFLHAEIPDKADEETLAPLLIEVAKSGDPVAQEAAVPIALRKETHLETFRADGVSDLEVTLQVPLTVGNLIQGEEDRVNWVFTAQTLPKYEKMITLHPVDITSYAGSSDMPTLRFRVEMDDGKPWDGTGLTFTLHQSDKSPAEVPLAPTPVPKSTNGYYAFPVLEQHLDLTGSGGLGGAMQWQNFEQSDGHAGRYDLALDTPSSWYIHAEDAEGNFYAVQVAPKGTHVSVRPVADEDGVQALTPVLHDESAVDTSAGGQDAIYGGHRAVAVIPADAAYYTNGRDSGLGLFGGTEQSEAPSIALLFDEPVALSDALQTEDMAALMVDHARHAGEWGGAGFSFEGWQYDFRYLDLVNTDDGNAWVSCDRPVVIYWPYPAEVRDHYQDYEFQILHYVGVDREYFQIPLDDAEQWGQTVLCDAGVPVQSLAVTAEAQGLRFTLPADPEGNSFSPFALLWREKGGGSSPDYPDDDDDRISVTVKKVWKLDDGGTAADAVTAVLLRNGEEYAAARLDAANGWRYTWNGLNDRYRWTVEEKNVPEGFTASVKRAGAAFTITNDDVPAQSPDTKPGTPVEPAPGQPAPGQPASGDSGQPSPSGSQAPQGSGSGTSSKGPTLPQTGQAWRPVFLMAAVGVVLLLIGLNMGKTGKGKHEA